MSLLAAPAEAQLYVSSLNTHEVLAYQPGTGELVGDDAILEAADNGLSRPHGILDRASGFIVASFGSNEVKRYHRETGAFIDNFIPNTAGLDLPVYLDVGPDDGLLYVSSQGNDRILRFNNNTGNAADAQPFIEGGLLDAPSGFDWSPDGTILYVAGRASGNVLAYLAATGAPRSEGHEFITELGGVNDTFGLKVDEATGDVFVATAGDVRRYDSSGALLATIPAPGLAIGLENSLDGSTLWVASNNTLYPINKSDNSVGSAFLIGGTISTLNFFHFSEFEDPTIGLLRLSQPTANEIALTAKLSLIDPPQQIVIQWSDDLSNWNTGPAYHLLNGGFGRDSSTSMSGSTIQATHISTTIQETDGTPVSSAPQRFYRLWTAP